MILSLIVGLGLPLLGTTAGAACVFFMKKQMNLLLQKALSGFAAGVMVAASIWSLLIPAMEQSEAMGKLAFLPATIGFWLGIIFLLLIDTLMPHLHIDSKEAEGVKSNFKRTTMMVFAIIIHNIPEGMKQNQNLLCYHYTIVQSLCAFLRKRCKDTFFLQYIPNIFALFFAIKCKCLTLRTN